MHFPLLYSYIMRCIYVYNSFLIENGLQYDKGECGMVCFFLCVQSSESPLGRAHANILTLLAGCHNHEFGFFCVQKKKSFEIRKQHCRRTPKNRLFKVFGKDMQPEAEAEAKNIIMMETVDRAASQPASRTGEMLILV